MDELQKILKADSPEKVEALAIARIKELNDSNTEKDKKIDVLEKKIADEEETSTDGDKPKDEEKPKDGEETEDGAEEKTEEADLKAENEKLKKENEELKTEAEEKGDAVKKLEDSVKELNTKTDAIGKKQVKPLFHNDDTEIEELKKARLNTYADARKAI